MTQAEVETAWVTDRDRLLSCRDEHKALTDFYAKRDQALTQQKETDAPTE